MFKTDVVIIGGGQAGLSLGHYLGDLVIDHLVLERGALGERWRKASWDSLRLLTPNWMNGLPSSPYLANDPDGFMTSREFVSSLEAHAARSRANIAWLTEVASVERRGDRFVIATSSGTIEARAVVIATGHCQYPNFPLGRHVAGPGVVSLHASEYRNPAQLDALPVLVVGASASGVQIADELLRHGFAVTLAAGSHTRLPRSWRGRDVFWWMRETGMLSQRTRDFHNPVAAARQPSLQLAGRTDRASVDLGTLQALGVRLAGRLAAIEDGRFIFADDLAASMNAAEIKLARLLTRFDAFAAPLDLPPDHTLPIGCTEGPLRSSRTGDFGTVIWATGYRRAFSWLKIPALTDEGEIDHVDGISRMPGLYALGFRFLRKRDSNFIHGVGNDAAFLAAEIARQLGQRFRKAV